MRVTATQRGFYVKLRSIGEEFDCPDALVSKKWMRPVEGPEPVETPAQVVELPAEPLATEAATSAPAVKKRRGRPPKVVSE